MGSALKQHGKRVGATGVVLATTVAATFAFPSAAAGVEEVRLIKGECEHTLKDASGQPLTVNLGLLGNISTGAVGSLLGGLGIDQDNVVVDSLGQICDTAVQPVKSATNNVSTNVAGFVEDPVGSTAGAIEDPAGTVNDITDDVLPGDSGGGPGDGDGSGEDPGGNTPPPGGGDGSGDAAPGAGSGDDTIGGGGGALPPVQAGQPVSVAAVAPLAPITVPPAAAIPQVAPPQAPDLGQPQPDSGRAPVVTEESGRAQALPPAEAPNRLPMLLAVIALVLVIAGLARSWLRRKAA